MFCENSKWICCGECDAPFIQKKIRLGHIKTAFIDICVLGFFEMYINNVKVSEDVLTPVCSQYEIKPGKNLLYPIYDTFSGSRAYYRRYDIAPYLICGENEISFYLGNGWYNLKDRTVEGDFALGTPKMRFEIFLEDDNGIESRIFSNDTLLWKPSYIKYNNIYYGEKHDYSQENNFTELKNVDLCDGIKSPLVLQECPSDRIIRKIVPRLIRIRGNKKIYDCGENITGWVSFRSEKYTKDVVITFSEEITDSGYLDYASTGYEDYYKQLQKDEFILNGVERICRPKFTWHGFRYFEFEGQASEITVEVVHADILTKADFSCDNNLLNILFDATKRSLLTNMHCGVISDCPHRERLGYTGDTQNTADIGMLLFEAEKLYSKIILDIADTQDVKSGHIQHTAPFYGGGGGPGGWGCAIVTIPYAHFKHYGDTGILKQYYPNMLKYIDYMRSRCENNLVMYEEKDGWCLGEWGTELPVEIPNEFVNTYFLVKSLILMQEIASVIGEPTKELKEYEITYKKALKDNFYDSDENTYCSGKNGADAFAADIGMANKNIIENLNNKYKNQKFDTGIFGTALLLDVLFKNGYADTAFKLLTENGENTFYDHHINYGATTLWENWGVNFSHNHHMFGSVVSCFFYHILGIDISENIIINPKIPENLNYISGSVKTRYGVISVVIKKESGQIKFDIYSQKDVIFKYNGYDYSICKEKHNYFNFDLLKEEVK